MRLAACVLLLLAAFGYTPPSVQAEEDQSASIVLREGLALPAVGAAGRTPVRVDPLELRLIRGEFSAPQAGDKVPRHDGSEVAWRAVSAGQDGWLRDSALRGGYVYFQLELDAPRVMMLHARGHMFVYVNGEIRGGDFYSNGTLPLPVRLKAGVNEFLFQAARGQLRAELTPLAADALPFAIQTDAVLPDVLAGQTKTLDAAITVVNPTRDNQVVAITSFGKETIVGPESLIPPFSTRKVPFRIMAEGKSEGEMQVHLLLLRNIGADSETPAGESSVTLKVVGPSDPRRVTFVSEIDGSVQYYAIQPAKPLLGQLGKPGIVLSLHGASVEATNQARAYSPKSWCHIVCPTNRRPFGFDWEDWGRLDAMEVLEHAKATLEHDPSKVWLTGHSMGGHGAWTVGAHYPDKFAAIGPSAGWESFWSYTGGGGHPPDLKLSPILTRGANPSRTLMMKHNYAAQGIYILHGDADDNVPVREARAMRDALKEFHNDLHYHEEPGAGHWWNRDATAGADCVDWPSMFDLFARRRLPAANEVLEIDFTTVHPGNSDRCHWAGIHMQQVQLEPSRIQLRADPNNGRISGTTSNVARLRLDPSAILQPGKNLTLELDGQTLELERGEGPLWLALEDGSWRVTDQPPAAWKGPHRYGQLKSAMRRQFVLVYGTRGSEAENAWMFNKARYDAEQWQYRANGSLDILPDTHFNAATYNNRDVILYGNADINSAFTLAGHAPVRLASGLAAVGKREAAGSSLAMLYCYPRADCAASSICVIGGTDLQGMRLTDRLAYFTSGAAFPDLLLLEPSMLTQGTAGVLAAGYFCEQWNVADGEFVWRDDEK